MSAETQNERLMNLETYLRKNHDKGIIDHSLRADVQADGKIVFYIHPQGHDGDTLELQAIENCTVPFPSGKPATMEDRA